MTNTLEFELLLFYESILGVIIYSLLLRRRVYFYDFEFILDLLFIVLIPLVSIELYLKNSPIGCSCIHMRYDLTYAFLYMILFIFSFLKVLHLYSRLNYKSFFLFFYFLIFFGEAFFIKNQFTYLKSYFDAMNAMKYIKGTIPNFNYTTALIKLMFRSIIPLINLFLIPLLFISRIGLSLNSSFKDLMQYTGLSIYAKLLLFIYWLLLIFAEIELLKLNVCTGF